MIISTRQATLADTPAIAPLFDAYRQFYEQAPAPELARAFIGERLERQESVIFVAESDGAMVGFCQLYPTFCSVEAAPIFTLYDLFVAEPARKSGAGRQMMLAAEHHARASGAVRLDLTTAKDNLRAQSVYEALDWVRDEIFYTYNKAVRSVLA
jgi:ribosomal protein S18 acetylase RimI-like enzyme